MKSTIDPTSSSKGSKATFKNVTIEPNMDAQDAFKKKLQAKAEAENSNLWQHPFVDVLKHFKLLPGSDWK